MPRCTVCNHPQLLEINQAILSGDFTLADLSRKYGLSSSALGRHKNHIEVTMSRTRRRLREIREQGSLLVLNDILEQVRRNIAAADAQGNYLAVFRGSHVASRLIHQMGRLEGDHEAGHPAPPHLLPRLDPQGEPPAHRSEDSLPACTRPSLTALLFPVPSLPQKFQMTASAGTRRAATAQAQRLPPSGKPRPFLT